MYVRGDRRQAILAGLPVSPVSIKAREDSSSRPHMQPPATSGFPAGMYIGYECNCPVDCIVESESPNLDVFSSVMKYEMSTDGEAWFGPPPLYYVYIRYIRSRLTRNMTHTYFAIKWGIQQALSVASCHGNAQLEMSNKPFVRPSSQRGDGIIVLHEGLCNGTDTCEVCNTTSVCLFFKLLRGTSVVSIVRRFPTENTSIEQSA